MQKTIDKTTIQLLKGDITDLEIDAIVNAANERLAHGGGVAGAISRKGGITIQQESDEWIRTHGNVHTGSAAITSGGNLKAKYVIHAVGPIMGSGDEDKKLENATLCSLEIAEKHDLTSIAFPAISTGIFGYPIERCAKIMLSTVQKFIEEGTKITKVIFCVWNHEAFAAFKKEIGKLA